LYVKNVKPKLAGLNSAWKVLWGRASARSRLQAAALTSRDRRKRFQPQRCRQEPPQGSRCLNEVRHLLAIATLALTGCGRGLVLDYSVNMTRDQMLARADHIFIGVIEKKEYENWLFLNPPGAKRGDWTILKRQVRIETVLRGQESRHSVFLYEYFPTEGLSGDWNSTQEGERDLFLVRVENGRYHVVRDFWRSIFRIYSGKHDRLPQNAQHQFWERVGLLTWWPGENHRFGNFVRMDPGQALGQWRTAKLARGFVRHPARDTRVFGCQVLLLMDRWQDECWEQLSPADRATLSAHGLIPPERLLQPYDFGAMEEWNRAAKANDLDMLRLLTTANRPTLRQEFCRLFAQRFPTDHDNGCPAGQPPPATIVTQDGDIPLIGPWPQVRQ
jgi:hypothetical protein